MPYGESLDDIYARTSVATDFLTAVQFSGSSIVSALALRTLPAATSARPPIH
jgi:hypothetical protein